MEPHSIEQMLQEYSQPAEDSEKLKPLDAKTEALLDDMAGGVKQFVHKISYEKIYYL